MLVALSVVNRNFWGHYYHLGKPHNAVHSLGSLYKQLTTPSSPASRRWGSSPSCLAARAVIRVWLDCRLPVVTTLSQPRCRASASRNSSLRIWRGEQ